MTFHVAIPYTAEQEAAVRQMQADGLSTGVIARRLKRSESSIVSCIQRLDRQEQKAKKQTRLCMCCKTPFTSEGPHNRLCCRCRTKEKPPFDF